MSVKLPTRPNLEHLREQAKDLLHSFRNGETSAVAHLREFLPAMAGKPDGEIAASTISLSDAQSAVARKHGFVSWQKLVKHVEALRAIDGTWRFTSLEIEGGQMPQAAFASSRMEIDGDAFRMVAPDAIYIGRCEIDVAVVPHTIDIHFAEGPEAGNSSYGIFEYDGRELKICLGLTGIARPMDFKTGPGSGHALETLQRGSADPSQPDSQTSRQLEFPPEAYEGFDDITAEIQALQGVRTPLALVMSGMKLPSQFLTGATRTMTGTESVVIIGGQVIIQAKTKIDATQKPMSIDYLLTAGPNKGKLQLGIIELSDDSVMLCFADPGMPRPTEFEAPEGSGHTLSIWTKP